jgi:hypothetical protein
MQEMIMHRNSKRCGINLGAEEEQKKETKEKRRSKGTRGRIYLP